VRLWRRCMSTSTNAESGNTAARRGRAVRRSLEDSAPRPAGHERLALRGRRSFGLAQRQPHAMMCRFARARMRIRFAAVDSRGHAPKSSAT
jgi:hypothetical protein